MDFITFDLIVALFTLTILEIVLGIDNIIFISIVSNKLPEEERPKARNIGLILALVFRVGMLFGITWVMKLTTPIISFDIMEFHVRLSGRDLILLIGGLFLIAKSTAEIHHKIEPVEKQEEKSDKKAVTLQKTIVQIVALDMVFSFDSILTAVGLTDTIGVMITAVVLSMLVMMKFAGKISDFINECPTLQVLALSFLILIGFMLMLEGFHVEVPKGYIYFAVCYALIVEIINMRMKRNKKA